MDVAALGTARLGDDRGGVVSSVRMDKAEIDAMVTTALRWTERGDVARMPEPARSVLQVTRDTATDVGRRLWGPNADHVPEDPLPDYVFEEIPGDPPPAIAHQLGAYYEYQFAGDDWEDAPGWNDGPPPFESYFAVALQWWAAVLLGKADGASVPAFDPMGDHAPDLQGLPEYDKLPWGFGDDRDLFIRD